MVNFVMGNSLPAVVTLGLTSAPAIFEISNTDIDNPSLASTISTAAAGLS